MVFNKENAITPFFGGWVSLVSHLRGQVHTLTHNLNFLSLFPRGQMKEKARDLDLTVQSSDGDFEH